MLEMLNVALPVLLRVAYPGALYEPTYAANDRLAGVNETCGTLKK